MITKNISRQPKSIVEVSITVPWADLEPKWNETLQRLANEVELPGFRKGQAPVQMVEQNLGSKVQDELLKIAMPQALIDALQGSDVVPIDYPKYELHSFAKGQDLSFKATVTEKPKIEIGDYKTLQVQRPVQKQVTDEDVNKLVDELFKRWKARGAQAPAGQAQPSGIVDAQGNPTTSSETPDDNFAKAVGANDLADLRAKIKADLENEAKYNNELDFEEAILQQVETVTKVEVPEILVQDELNRMLVSLQRRVAEMGLLLEDYLKSQNKTLDSLKTEWRPQAEKNVKMELGLSEIAGKENIDITDAELQAEIDKIQDAKLKAQFEQQEPRLHLRHSLRQLRTLDLLKTLVKTS
jgi:trigger factor